MTGICQMSRKSQSGQFNLSDLTLASVFSDEICMCSEIHPDSGVSALESNPMLALLSATFPDAKAGI